MGVNLIFHHHCLYTPKGFSSPKVGEKNSILIVVEAQGCSLPTVHLNIDLNHRNGVPESSTNSMQITSLHSVFPESHRMNNCQNVEEKISFTYSFTVGCLTFG